MWKGWVADEYIKHVSRILHKAREPRTARYRPEHHDLLCNKPRANRDVLELVRATDSEIRKHFGESSNGCQFIDSHCSGIINQFV